MTTVRAWRQCPKCKGNIKNWQDDHRCDIFPNPKIPCDVCVAHFADVDAAVKAERAKAWQQAYATINSENFFYLDGPECLAKTLKTLKACADEAARGGPEGQPS